MAIGWTAWFRLISPVRPWRSIAWAREKPDCVDYVADWLQDNRAILRKERFSLVILETNDGTPDGKSQPGE